MDTRLVDEREFIAFGRNLQCYRSVRATLITRHEPVFGKHGTRIVEAREGGIGCPSGIDHAAHLSLLKPALRASQVFGPRPASRSLYFCSFWFGV